MNQKKTPLAGVELFDVFYDPDDHKTYVIIHAFFTGVAEPDELRFWLDGDCLERLNHVPVESAHKVFSGCPVNEFWSASFVGSLVGLLRSSGLAAIATLGVPLLAYGADVAPVASARVSKMGGQLNGIVLDL